MISLRRLQNVPAKTLLSASRVSTPSSRSHRNIFLRTRDFYRYYSHTAVMSTNFGSTTYASAFQDLPVPNVKALRNGALEYLDNFDSKLWYDDPITTIFRGEKLEGHGSPIETKDALGKINGRQYLATPSQVAALKDFMSTYKSPYTDLRDPIRRIEERLLGEYSGFLIGNQCIDFQKQDGVTEMEEATMANAVERRLNDMLLQDEIDGKLTISRKPIYVSCVSNFTNFLDLFRKTLRSLELGIPCVVLSRSNTVQHPYRWTELLVDLMRQEGIDDLGMVTYLSGRLEDIKDITRSCREHTGNLYATCSRALAADMMSGYPNTVASTGGPNTLVTTEWNDSIQEAIRLSAAIESSGQCTALRHCVVPSTVKEDQVLGVFESITDIPDAVSALKNNMFDGVFANHQGSKTPSDDETGKEYIHESTTDAYFKFQSGIPDANKDMEEYWRKVVVDFSRMKSDVEMENNTEELFALAKWLNTNQPISLAINAHFDHRLELGMKLFEKTGMVVYTIGSTNNPKAPPALTCQARPQEAEVFGEFPPRASLGKYTKYPVVVPSSTPSYDSTYTPNYLHSVSLSASVAKDVATFVQSVNDKTIRGYCIELVNYLEDATRENPKPGHGSSRTVLWGLQRPPLMTGLETCIRCSKDVTMDAIAPYVIIFFATNARHQMELSIDPHNKHVLDACQKLGVPVLAQSEEEFSRRRNDATHPCYNFVDVTGPMKVFPMVGNFVSLYMPLGHVKSTMLDDEDFVAKFQKSKKWLKMHW